MGEVLPGASIVVKGQDVGSVTNAEGKFSINVPDENTILDVSFISYESTEVNVGGSSQLSIALTRSAKQLNEMVVVGYGSQQKRKVMDVVAIVRPADDGKTILFDNLPHFDQLNIVATRVIEHRQLNRAHGRWRNTKLNP